MRPRTPLAALLLVAAPTLALLPLAAALAQEPPAAPAPPAPVAAASADAGARHNPDNKTGLAEWMDRCVQGNAKFEAKDVPGAIDSYKQAIQLAPKRPLPHYLLAEAQLSAQNFPDAEAALKDATDVSDDRDADLRAEILFLAADLKEREHKYDDAKVAWGVYADYAAKHADAGAAPGTPPARIQAIDAMIKQDKAYDVVRERIVAEIRDAGTAATPRKK